MGDAVPCGQTNDDLVVRAMLCVYPQKSGTLLYAAEAAKYNNVHIL